jgi:hypothetical protein
VREERYRNENKGSFHPLRSVCGFLIEFAQLWHNREEFL